MLSISRTSLYNWRENASNIMRANVSTQQSKKRKVQCQVSVPILEQAVNTYMRDRINYMEGESLFWMHIFCNIALTLRDQLVVKLTTEHQVHNQVTPKELDTLETFNASPHWFQNFMLRNKFMSYTSRGQGPAADPVVVANSRSALRETLFVTDVQDICNSDEVGVLFRSLPSRSVGTSDKSMAYKRANERLTAVLTVFADGAKAPLVIIGKSKKARSFFKNFDPKADLGIHYYSQSQACNTQSLWKEEIVALDHTARVEGRKMAHAIDNCSARSIENSCFDNVEPLYFPPNLTSVLQPVDAGVCRSFKATFRHLHVLQFTNHEMQKAASDCKKFKMHEAITVFDAVKMMGTTWDMVHKRVVLKIWLSCKILAPYQELLLHDAMNETRRANHKAKLPIRGRAFDTDMLLYHQRTVASKKKGLCFLQELYARKENELGDAECVSAAVVDDWLEKERQTFKEDLEQLEEMGVIEDLCVGEHEVA